VVVPKEKQYKRKEKDRNAEKNTWHTKKRGGPREPPLCFTLFHAVSRCFTLFHSVSRCFTLFHAVSLCFTPFHVFSRLFTPFCAVSLCFTLFYDLAASSRF